MYKIIFFLFIFIISCKHKQSVVLCSGVEDGLGYMVDSNKKDRDKEYYDKLLHKIHPNIQLVGMFYDLKTNKQKSDDDYCSIILSKENFSDSIYISGYPGFGKEFKYGKYNIKYKSVNRFNIDVNKKDTILYFDSLAFYRLDIFVDDSINKIQFKLKKIYQF